jgi:hypothetical protein
MTDFDKLASTRPNVSKDINSVQPLNPVLYSKLKRAFGVVKFANEGYSFLGRPTYDYQSAKKSYDALTWGEYYSICCPYCKDTRFRLWINHRYGVFDDWSGTRQKYLTHCYNENCMAVPGNRKHFQSMILDGLPVKAMTDHMRRGEIDDNATLTETVTPGDMVELTSLDYFHPCIAYLGSRGYNVKNLNDIFGVRYCKDSPYEDLIDRIYIPVYIEGKLVSWQGRYVGDLDWKRAGTIKYFTCPSSHISRSLYNYDTASKYKFGVVTEGPSDVWSTGPFSVAVFKNRLSARQRKLVLTNWSQSLIIIYFDAQEREVIDDLVDELSVSCSNVVPAYCPYKDPGSTSPEMNWNILRGACADRGIKLEDYV